MAKNTGNSKFRKVDVDQYTESSFQDDQTEDAGAVKFTEADVKALMDKSKHIEGLQLVLQTAPINSKNQAMKDSAFKLVMRLLSNIKPNEIDNFVSKLDNASTDLLIKYIYRGFEQSTEGNYVVLLTWHEKIHAKGKAGCIVRVLTDRRRV